MDRYVREPRQSMNMQTMALLVRHCVWQSPFWDIVDILKSKRNGGSLCSDAARSTSSGSRDDLIEHLFPRPFFAAEIDVSVIFQKLCCFDGFQMSQMHLNTWYCLNTRAKVWNWNGSPGTITTAPPQVKGASVCARVSTYSIVHTESVLLTVNGIYTT